MVGQCHIGSKWPRVSLACAETMAGGEVKNEEGWLMEVKAMEDFHPKEHWKRCEATT